jgi:hypothetical protein
MLARVPPAEEVDVAACPGSVFATESAIPDFAALAVAVRIGPGVSVTFPF